MGFESSVSDLDLALVFAEIAVCSDSSETRSRNLANAHDIFFRLRDEWRLYAEDGWQRSEIEARLQKLRKRLEFLAVSLRRPQVNPAGLR